MPMVATAALEYATPLGTKNDSGIPLAAVATVPGVTVYNSARKISFKP